MGNKGVHEKLRLDGESQVKEAQFTSPEVEQKVESLSCCGQAVMYAHGGTKLVSNFKGQFKLKEGVMTFPPAEVFRSRLASELARELRIGE